MTETTLPRRKPQPAPPVRPVPEIRADAALRAAYEDTKQTLQAPWMGVVTMAFAHYPTFWRTLWSGVRPLALSAPFVDACARIRAEAEAGAERLEAAGAPPASAVREGLGAAGYAEAERDEIRALIETFSHGNPPYLLIATAARLLLEGEALSDARAAPPFVGRHGPAAGARLTLMEPHHADAPTRALYEDVKTTLGLPFVNTDYRALARWPSAFALMWADLKPRLATPAYQTAVDAVHSRAVAEMRALPNPGALTPQALAEAAAADGAPAETAEVARLFQWLLPGLLVNVARFRAQLA